MKSSILLLALAVLSTGCSTSTLQPENLIDDDAVVLPTARADEGIDDKTYVVWCNPSLLSIDEAPNTNTQQAIEVEYDELLKLVDFLDAEREQVIANSKNQAFDRYMKRIQLDANDTPERAWNLSPKSGGSKITFAPVRDKSIPINGLWLITPGPQYLHVLEKESRIPPKSGKFTYPNRKIAYARNDGKIWNVYATFVAYPKLVIAPKIK